MRTIKTVDIAPVFLPDTMPDVMEENKLYISEQYGVAIHLCLCGCKEKTVTPLGGGDMWTLVKESEGVVSLIGSIGNFQFPCKSHYIITKNKANFV